MQPEDEVIRGNQARAILQDKLYQESWAVVEAQLVSLLKQVDIDPEKEKRVLYALKGLAKAKGYLESVMTTGKMAAQQIERDKTFTERRKDKIRSVA